MELILEEVVGEFTSSIPGHDDDVTMEDDGSYLVRGNAYLRDINRHLGWRLPTDVAKTINGLIIEYLEDIPEAATCFRIENYVIEIVQSRDTSVHVARLTKLNQSSPSITPI